VLFLFIRALLDGMLAALLVEAIAKTRVLNSFAVGQARRWKA
jgi:ABC-type thiamin/hydroxymethylpyrimidine transport system permease subunit